MKRDWTLIALAAASGGTLGLAVLGAITLFTALFGGLCFCPLS